MGTTPSKRLLNLAVVERNGEPLSRGRAFGRSLAEILGSGWHCLLGWYYLRAFSGFDSMIGMHRALLEQPLAKLLYLRGNFYGLFVFVVIFLYQIGDERVPHDWLFGTRVVKHS